MPVRSVTNSDGGLIEYAEPQNFPEHQYPSIVGRPILRSEERSGDIVVKDIMCGDEAAAARSMLQITYPVCRVHTWEHTFMEVMLNVLADQQDRRWRTG